MIIKLILIKIKMGELWRSCACCDRREQYQKTDILKVRGDRPLPPIDKKDLDKYQLLHRSLPFSRTHMNWFLEVLDSIKSDNDEEKGEVDVEIEQLRKKFSASSAWSYEANWTEGSSFRRILLALPGTKDGKVTKMSLKCLAIFWCQGTDYDRAELLLECISP